MKKEILKMMIAHKTINPFEALAREIISLKDRVKKLENGTKTKKTATA